MLLDIVVAVRSKERTMIQHLNFDPQRIFHSTAIHTVGLLNCVLVFAEGFLWSFWVISVADLVYKG